MTALCFGPTLIGDHREILSSTSGHLTVSRMTSPNRVFLCLALCVSLAITVVESDSSGVPVVRHLKVGKMHYLNAGRNHYGFTHEENSTYKTVSVNGDTVSVWLPDCTCIVRKMHELNKVDRKEVKNAQKLMHSVYKDFGELSKREPDQVVFMETYELGNEANLAREVTEINEHGAIRYLHSPSDQVDYGDNELSLVDHPKLPEGVLRAFVLKKALGYVYPDRFIIMKPRRCQFLDDDSQLIQALGMKF